MCLITHKELQNFGFVSQLNKYEKQIHPLEDVARFRDPQLQAAEKIN